MTIPGVGAVCGVALLQGALVALPREDALASLRRLRSPAWAAVLPGCVVVGTFAPLGAHSFALGMIVLAALATPPLAAVALLAVVRGPRAALAALALAAGALATLAGGLSGELSATFLTALGAITLGAALARLIPAHWVLAGVVCMCAVDVALLAVGLGQPASAVIAGAAAHVHAPLFDHAQVGPVALDYPDLVLAAVLGGFLAGQRGQRSAAVLVSLLAAASLMLAPANTMWPATVPVAITLLALRTVGLPRRPEVTPLATGPANV
jgi:hypothetical protein